MTNTNKTPALIGAGLGLATFLAIALLPAMLYGGYAGVLLAGGIFGTPVTASLGVAQAASVTIRAMGRDQRNCIVRTPWILGAAAAGHEAGEYRGISSGPAAGRSAS